MAPSIGEYLFLLLLAAFLGAALVGMGLAWGWLAPLVLLGALLLAFLAMVACVALVDR